MSSRAIIVLSAALLFATPPGAALAQPAAAGRLPAPAAPGGIAQGTAPALPGTNAAAMGQTQQRANDGLSGTVTASIQRAPLAAPTPGAVPDTPDPAAASSLNRHLDAVQDLLIDQEDVRPDMVEQGEKLEWSEMDQALEDGDFAAANSAEKQIGWSARGKNGDKPKLRRPKIDLKAMTRLKLNESGSTVLDITKGRIITKF